MTDYFTAAQVTARKVQEETGLTLAELAALPLDEWARLQGRPTPAEAAIAEFNREQDSAQTPQASTPPAPQPPQASPAVPDAGPQGIDPNSQEYFLAWRAQRTSHGEGKGIFDSVGSQSDAYTAAVRAQAGRTAMSQSNVVEPPRLTDRYVRQDDLRDPRSAAERFGNPSNFYNR
jgi:hypothetical protein